MAEGHVYWSSLAFSNKTKCIKQAVPQAIMYHENDLARNRAWLLCHGTS